MAADPLYGLTVEALGVRLGLELEEDTPAGDRAAALLTDTLALIEQYAAVTLAAPLPATVAAVAYSRAGRIYLNPQGTRSESIGNYSYSVDPGQTTTGFTDAEIAVLRRQYGRGLGTIVVTQPGGAAAPTTPPTRPTARDDVIEVTA